MIPPRDNLIPHHKRLQRPTQSNAFRCEHLEPRILLDGDDYFSDMDDSSDYSSDDQYDYGQSTDSSNSSDFSDSSDSSNSSNSSDASDSSDDFSPDTYDDTGDTTQICPPAAPLHLALQSPSSSRIFLTWQNNDDDRDFIKVKRLDDRGYFVTIATLNNDATSFSDKNLQVGQTYTYAVIAGNSAGNSHLSNIASLTLANPDDPTLIAQFGHLPGGPKSVPFSFFDADGTKVILKLSGPGIGSIHLTDAGYNIALTGTTLASALHISTQKSHTPGDDGRFTLNALTVDNPNNAAAALGKLSANTTDLTSSLTITGPTLNLTLGNLTDASLSLGSLTSPSASTKPLNITLGQVTDSSLDSSLGIHTLKALQWSAAAPAAIPITTDTISAPFLQKLTITGHKAHNTTPALAGDFQANLNLSATLLPASPTSHSPAPRTLASASIHGTLGSALSPASWTLTGSTGPISAASATNWSLSLTDSSSTPGDLASLTLSSRTATSTLDLDANSLATLTIKGSLSDSLLLLRQPPDISHPALGHALITGTLANSTLRSAGNIASLTAGILDHSLLFAGIRDSLNSLPTTPTDFTPFNATPPATLSKITLTGIPTSFDIPASPVLIDSNIAAPLITRATLPRRPSAIADPDQSPPTAQPTPFGFATLLSPVTKYAGPISTGNFISGNDSTI